MVSGVWVCAWIARNCERSWAISVGVKPAERRRSKPRGAGVVVVVVCRASLGESGPLGSVLLARAASAASSAAERTTSPIEQWM